MTVLGIIAEYNPFHKGHAYQIETLRKETGADYVIIAMSGNFVQRGAPALVDKYTRTRMALLNGADLVLELPVVYACASAELFAKGGVMLLQSTGVVSHLGFGAESSDLSLLQEIADTLCENPPAFSKKLQQELKNGLSFPAARAAALELALTDAENGLSMDSASEENNRSIDSLSANFSQIRQVLSSPNNILAIEYLKALNSLNSDIQPALLLRKGAGYHDMKLPDSSAGFCSASAIRTYLKNGQSVPCNVMPESAHRLLTSYPHDYLFEDDFSQLVHYKLLTESPESLASFADSSIDLANRMYHNRHSFESWSQFCELLKSKNTTYTRISRLLLHLILNITTSDYSALEQREAVPYLRVLGFRKAAAPLLSRIKETGNASLLTGISGVENQLSFDALSILQKDVTASDLYHLALTSKGGRNLLNDYRHPVVTV